MNRDYKIWAFDVKAEDRSGREFRQQSKNWKEITEMRKVFVEEGHECSKIYTFVYGKKLTVGDIS